MAPPRDFWFFSTPRGGPKLSDDVLHVCVTSQELWPIDTLCGYDKFYFILLVIPALYWYRHNSALAPPRDFWFFSTCRGDPKLSDDVLHVCLTSRELWPIDDVCSHDKFYFILLVIPALYWYRHNSALAPPRDFWFFSTCRGDPKLSDDVLHVCLTSRELYLIGRWKHGPCHISVC